MTINATSSDFNGDRTDDLLWARDGSVSTWTAGPTGQALSFRQNAYFANVDRRWDVVDTADFNGDGRADILWRHDDGRVSIWNGLTGGFQQGSFNGFAANSWDIEAVQDFNGDGKADLLWQRDDGALSIWTANAAGTGFNQNTYFRGAVQRGWEITASGDFNGDGRGDLVWTRDNGDLSVWTGTGSGFVENSYFTTVRGDWDIEATGDVNGDGRDDLVWQRDNGDISVWQGTAAGFAQNSVYIRGDRDWELERAADFTGDGRADLLLRDDDNGDIAIWGATQTGFDQNSYFQQSPRGDWDLFG